MVQRGITTDDVRHAIASGTVIEEYPTDTPYPSRLILGFVQGRALHVVAAFDAMAQEMIVVTAYDPDPNLWDAEYKRRKP
jgi:hypothetical protein